MYVHVPYLMKHTKKYHTAINAEGIVHLYVINIYVIVYIYVHVHVCVYVIRYLQVLRNRKEIYMLIEGLHYL